MIVAWIKETLLMCFLAYLDRIFVLKSVTSNSLLVEFDSRNFFEVLLLGDAFGNDGSDPIPNGTFMLGHAE